MTAAPGADERRIRSALDARGVGYAPQPPADARTRDWLDDLWADDPPTEPASPPAPPRAPKEARQAADGPSWDWRRLMHWPYARPTVGAGVALIPWFGAYSPATWWGSVLTQARTEAGVGAAWVIAGVGLTVAAVLVNRRRTWPAYAALTCAFIGTIAMASPFDIVQFVTGVQK
jgi:hypothetical protein